MDQGTRRTIDALDHWEERRGPRYHRLAGALGELIDRHVIAADERLPAERTLAAALGVSRGTVVAAYDELAQAGLVVRRQGSGTRARRPHRGEPRPGRDNPAAVQLRRRLTGGADLIDLSLSLPTSVDHLPPSTPLALTPAQLAHTGSGLHPTGLPELRAAIARHLTEQLQLPTTPEQLIVTTGAQQALSLLSAASVRPGVPVLLPCPTYPAGIAVLSRAGGHLVPLPTDSAGVQPQPLERALEANPHAVTYLIPTGDNPGGSVMPAARRQRVGEIVAAHDTLVIEDLTLAALTLDGDPPPPLAATHDDVVAVGSVSKLLWAGLRVGWIRVDGPRHERLYRLKAAADLGSGIPEQLLATELLGGVDDAWLRDHRADLADRRDHLLGELARHLPDFCPNRPEAGLSLWVSVPAADTEELARVALTHGVAVMPGQPACHDHGHLDHIRISFADAPEVLTVGVERLAAAWRAHQDEG